MQAANLPRHPQPRESTSPGSELEVGGVHTGGKLSRDTRWFSGSAIFGPVYLLASGPAFNNLKTQRAWAFFLGVSWSKCLVVVGQGALYLGSLLKIPLTGTQSAKDGAYCLRALLFKLVADAFKFGHLGRNLTRLLGFGIA